MADVRHSVFGVWSATECGVVWSDVADGGFWTC